MTLQEALKKGQAYLQENQVADAEIDAWYLMQYAIEQADGTTADRSWYLMHREETMLPAAYARYQWLLTERGKHIPLQHLTGEQEFMGITFQVNDQVLIPRQDTEILVEEAMKYLRSGMKVLDMCTGSGCIMISLMKYVPGILGVASDVSEKALQVAKSNAVRQEACIDFRHGDLFESVDGSFDMIVSNPPYIPTHEIDRLMAEVRLYDPFGALDGREDGLYFYRKLTELSPSYLKPGGWLMMEIGSGQGAAVTELLERAAYEDIYIVKDLAGHDRVAAGRSDRN